MKRLLVAFIAAIICCLAGCATSFNSIRNEETGRMELIAGSESELLSAAYEAITRKFPAANVNQITGYETGFSWFHQPLLDRTNLKFLLKEQIGLTNDGLEVSGYSYSIVTYGTQGFVEARYVQPLATEFNNVLAERGIQKIFVEKIVYKKEAGSNKIPGSGRKLKTGTGFFISSVGHLITNHHVIADANEVSISLMNGQSFAAKVIQSDPINDVALLKAETTASPLKMTSTINIIKGDEVFTLGYPLVGLQGQEQKATFGRINALSGVKGDIRFFQIDVPIQPGNSGGPLFDKNGYVVGIITATLHQKNTLRATGALPQNVNYAVKSDYIMPLINLSVDEKPIIGTNVESMPLNKLVKEVEKSVVLVIVK